MRNRIPAALAAMVLMASVAAETRAETPPNPDRKAIERIVRDYLIAHPEVIEEAVMALRAKRERDQGVRNRAAIVKHRDALLAHPKSPVSGDASGDVTVVEFFDYQCGFCRRSLKPMLDLLRTDKRVRVVWKEFPILGPVSTVAARASVAAARQGRYEKFHVALMGASGKLTEKRVFEIAGRTGLDVERLRRDMADPAIAAYLDETRKLGQAIGVRGTPAFVIGDKLVPGAIDSARLTKLIAAARSGK